MEGVVVSSYGLRGQVLTGYLGNGWAVLHRGGRMMRVEEESGRFPRYAQEKPPGAARVCVVGDLRVVA